MFTNTSIHRIELNEFPLTQILTLVEKLGKPFIITRQEKGIAAIIPYTDPNTLKRKKDNSRCP